MDDHRRSSRQAIDEMLRDRIIPRLVEGSFEIGFSKVKAGREPELNTGLDTQQIENLADNLVEGNEVEVGALFESMFEQGHTVSDLFLELLSPTAVELGARWKQDLCSFADVTMGMSVLHTVLRNNSKRLAMELASDVAGLSILVTPMPGQTHVFGASVVEEFFRAANWDVHSGLNCSEDELLTVLANEHFTLVGLSVAHNGLIESCKDFISKIRNVSLNQEIGIMVGGPVFVLDPLQVEAVGADVTASDARQALETARLMNGKIG